MIKVIESVDEHRFQWIVEPLIHWYGKNSRVLPWRENMEPYRVWISEIMLQQTRVEAVIAYYNRFLDRFPTIRALAKAKEEEVLKLWEGLGYYSRARNLKKTAEIICSEYDGEFPGEYKQLLALPGIGKYTAGSISSIAFGLPRAAVDGNVLRVVTRLEENDTNVMDEKFRREITKALERVYPAGQCSEFTQSLMELGALVCVPNGKPKCEECPLHSGCEASKHATWERYPVKKSKSQRRKLEKTVFVIRCNDRIAVQKGKKTGLLAGLWKLPETDRMMQMDEIEHYLTEQGLAVSKVGTMKKVKHIFTHIEWHIKCYQIECQLKTGKYEWVSLEELDERIALPTAYRKCL